MSTLSSDPIVWGAYTGLFFATLGFVLATATLMKAVAEKKQQDAS